MQKNVGHLDEIRSIVHIPARGQVGIKFLYEGFLSRSYVIDYPIDSMCRHRGITPLGFGTVSVCGMGRQRVSVRVR